MQTDTDNTTAPDGRVYLRRLPADLWADVRAEAIRQRLPRVELLVERYLREGLARDRASQREE